MPDGGVITVRPKLLLLDGHNLAYRAFWALANVPGGPLESSAGVPTAVCFGFLRSLSALLQTERPAALAVAFDAPGGSFRHQQLPSYKAQRPPSPASFGPDLANLRTLLRFLRVPCLEAPGYEADDLLAGLAAAGSQAGYAVRLVSGDMDLYQAVSDDRCVAVLAPPSAAARRSSGSGSSAAAPPTTLLVDEAAVRRRLGVEPSQVPAYKALAGDASDNLPGVQGVGPKRAVRLLAGGGGLAEAYARAPGLGGGLARLLEGSREGAERDCELATLRLEAAQGVDIASLALRGFNRAEVEPLLLALELRGAAQALPQLQQLLGGEACPNEALAAVLPDALLQMGGCVTGETAV